MTRTILPDPKPIGRPGEATPWRGWQHGNEMFAFSTKPTREGTWVAALMRDGAVVEYNQFRTDVEAVTAAAADYVRATAGLDYPDYMFEIGVESIERWVKGD